MWSAIYPHGIIECNHMGLNFHILHILTYMVFTLKKRLNLWSVIYFFPPILQYIHGNHERDEKPYCASFGCKVIKHNKHHFLLSCSTVLWFCSLFYSWVAVQLFDQVKKDFIRLFVTLSYRNKYHTCHTIRHTVAALKLINLIK